MVCLQLWGTKASPVPRKAALAIQQHQQTGGREQSVVGVVEARGTKIAQMTFQWQLRLPLVTLRQSDNLDQTVHCTKRVLCRDHFKVVDGYLGCRVRKRTSA